MSSIHSELSVSVSMSIFPLISSNIDWISLPAMYPLISSSQSLLSSLDKSSILLLRLINRLSFPSFGIEDREEIAGLFPSWGIAFSTSVRSFVISCFNKSNALMKSKLFSPIIVSIFSSRGSSSFSSLIMSKSVKLSSSFFSGLTIVIVSILFLIVFKTSSISGFSPDKSLIKSENLLKSCLISAITWAVLVFSSKASSNSFVANSSDFSSSLFSASALIRDLKHFFKSSIALMISSLLTATVKRDFISSCWSSIFSARDVLMSSAVFASKSFCSCLKTFISSINLWNSAIWAASGGAILFSWSSNSVFRESILIIIESTSPKIKSLKLFSVVVNLSEILSYVFSKFS